MKDKMQKEVDEVLDMADRFLAEWLEDLDNGIGGDGARYHRDCETLAGARVLIKTAPGLLRALKDLTKEINLKKLNIRKDFSIINAHACALRIIHDAEARP